MELECDSTEYGADSAAYSFGTSLSVAIVAYGCLFLFYLSQRLGPLLN